MRSIAIDQRFLRNWRVRVSWWAISGPLLFVWGLWITLAYDFGLADETWFLQVLTRVAGGDVLYRDVFWGATPLAVYLAAPLVALFGSEIVVVKAFVTLCFVWTIGLCARMLRGLGGGRLAIGMLLLALLSYVWPRQAAGYTPLAYALLLCCLCLALMWHEQITGANNERAARTTLVLAGVAAGLCFGAKQNIGAYAVIALGITTLFSLWHARRGWGKTFSGVAIIAAAFALTCLITVAPIVLSGGGSQFLDYGFTNKRTYLQVGGFSYLEGIKQLRIRAQSIDSLADLRWIYAQTIFLLPPLALVGTLFTWIAASRQQRGYLVIVGCFVGAALAGIYPRADIEHVVYAVPALLLCLSYAGVILATRLPRWTQRVLQIGLILWFGAGVGLIGSGALGRVLSPAYDRSTLPHFRGVWIAKKEQAAFRRYGELLQTAAAGEQPFLLSPYAAFYYLTTGLDNPTPFDYPLVTAFGQQGQANVMAAIRAGQIRTVCHTDMGRYQLSPGELEQFVVDHMERSADLEFCTLYRIHAVP